MTENHEEALAWLQKNAPDLGVHDFEPGDVIVNVYKLRTVLEKIHEIRNSIVGLQTINWSEHIYPLVAALGEIGLNAEGYEISHPRFCTMLERTVAAEKKAEHLTDAFGAVVDITQSCPHGCGASVTAVKMGVDRK